jgi:hypothetical protein
MMGPRAEGRHIPRTCIDPRMLQYREIGRLGRYVQQFFSAVGRDRCLVVPFDDLRAHPAAAYRRLMAFLDLTPQACPDLKPRRSAAGFRHGWLQRFLKRPPVATRMVLAGEKFRRRLKPVQRRGPDPTAVRAILAARRALLRWNAAPPPAVRLDDALRLEIAAALRPDIDLLSRLTGRDFGHWLRTSEAEDHEPAAREASAA